MLDHHCQGLHRHRCALLRHCRTLHCPLLHGAAPSPNLASSCLHNAELCHSGTRLCLGSTSPCCASAVLCQANALLSIAIASDCTTLPLLCQALLRPRWA